MGLLSDGDGSDPQSMAVYSLAAGLLSPGSFGQELGKGLSGYRDTLTSAQDMQLKQQQLAEAKQNMAMQQLNMQMALRKQAYMYGDPNSPDGGQPATAPQIPQAMPSFMTGSGSLTPQQNASNMAAANAPQPGMPSQAQQTPQMPQQAPPQPGIDARFGLPTNEVRADMIMNDGKNIAQFMHDANKPVALRPGGYAAYADGRITQLPQVPEGFQAVRGSDGNWQMVPVANGPAAVAASSTAKASGAAGFKQTQVIGADNSQYTVFNKNLPGFNDTPPGTPSIPPSVPMLPQQSGATPSAPVNPQATTPQGPSAAWTPQVQVPPAQQAARDASAIPLLQAEIGNLQAKLQANPGDRQAQSDLAAQTRELALRTGQANAPTPAVTAALNGAPPSTASLPPGAVKTGFAPGVIQNADAGAQNAQNLMTNSYKTVMANAQPAQTVQARLDNISQLANAAITGGNTEWRDYANNLMQMAGISDRAMDRKTAGDLIDKNAAQISLAIGSGTQGTDALRALASAANPNRGMTPDAIQEAVGQLQASAQVQQAKAQLLTPQYNAQTPAAYNTTEQAFDKNADYRLWQIKNQTQGMSAPQITQYFQSKGYTPAQVKTFQAQRATLQQLGVGL